MGSKDILLGKIRSGEHLSTGNQLSLALRLGTPAIIAQLSSVIMQYIDSAMVGHLDSSSAAAISLVSTCLWLLGGLCFVCCNGFSVQVAHLVGANDFASARKVVRQALTFALIWSAALSLAGLAVAQRLPYWLGGSPEIADMASGYFRICCLFLPLMQLDYMAATLLQCSGNMKIPSILNVMMCVLDVLFNYIFIYMMDMGVEGAALGSGLAEAVTAAAMLYFLVFRSRDLRIMGEKGSFVPSGKILRKAADIGLPMCLQSIIMRGAYIAGTVIVAPLGTIAIAANGFAITAESFCYMPGYGISDATTTLVGQSLGAGRKSLAKRFGWMNTVLGAGMMTAMAALMYLFAPELIGVMSPDPEVIELGAKVLRIEAFAETMYGASIILFGACVGAGDTLWPSILNFSSMWILRIIPAVFLTKTYGLSGFWMAMAFELNVRGLIFIIYYALRKFRSVS